MKRRVFTHNARAARLLWRVYLDGVLMGGGVTKDVALRLADVLGPGAVVVGRGGGQ